jgi:hypothetical protein
MSFNPYPSVPSSYSYPGNVVAVEGFLNVIGIDRARQGGCVKQAVGADFIWVIFQIGWPSARVSVFSMKLVAGAAARVVPPAGVTKARGCSPAEASTKEASRALSERLSEALFANSHSNPSKSLLPPNADEAQRCKESPALSSGASRNAPLI